MFQVKAAYTLHTFLALAREADKDSSKIYMCQRKQNKVSISQHLLVVAQQNTCLEHHMQTQEDIQQILPTSCSAEEGNLWKHEWENHTQTHPLEKDLFLLIPYE